jgi:hypothetical protein
VVEIILEGLANGRSLSERGTMEERSRMVPAFVQYVTIEGASESGKVQ